MAQTVMVLGGNGFIGREICRELVAADLNVISLSRKGRPALKAEWANKVEWLTGDVLKPEGWQARLAECQALVHCVAIIRQNSSAGLTFDRVIAGSVEEAVKAAQVSNLAKFVFLSIESKPPVISVKFLKAKRRAEEVIKESSLDYAILRLPLVYGWGRPPTILAGQVWKLAVYLPKVGAKLRETKPLSVTDTARIAVKAVVDPSVKGVLSNLEVHRLISLNSA